MNRYEFTRRVLIVTGIVGLAVTIGAMLALAYDIFLLLFLAVLLTILLRGASDAVSRYTKLGPGWSLALVVVVLLAITAGGAYALGSMVVSQLNRFATDFPRSLEQARAYLLQYEWGRQALEYLPSVQRVISGGPDQAAARFTSFFSTTFGLLGNLVFLIFLTLYMAANPRMYQTGLLKLVPPRRRERASEVMNAVAFHLRWWLVGRLVAMFAVGVITAVGLWIIGVPQFLVLGIVAALLTAIPFIGPIIAAIPGLLLAFMQGPDVALWALVVYVIAQAVENYLLTPLIQQNTVELPPVLTIAAIALVGALFGVFGLIVATPMMLTVMVLVKTLYIEDVLGDRVKVPGEHPSPTPA